MCFLPAKKQRLAPHASRISNAGPKVFAAADRDGNGKLTPHEFGAASFMKFKTYDLGQNCSMTLDDVRAVVKK